MKAIFRFQFAKNLILSSISIFDVNQPTLVSTTIMISLSKTQNISPGIRIPVLCGRGEVKLK